MKHPRSPFFLIAVLYFITSCEISGHKVNINRMTSLRNTVHTYQIIGINLCIDRCIIRSACQAVDYDLQYLTCVLLGFNSSTAAPALVQEEGIVLRDVTSLKTISECPVLQCAKLSLCLTTANYPGHKRKHHCVEEAFQSVSSTEASTSGNKRYTSMAQRKPIQEYLVFTSGKYMEDEEYKEDDEYMDDEDYRDDEETTEEELSVHHLDASGQHLKPLKVHGSCGFGIHAAAYDKKKVFLLCNGEEDRLAVGNYNEYLMRFESDIKLPGSYQYNEISVDIENGVMFALDDDCIYKMELEVHGTEDEFRVSDRKIFQHCQYDCGNIPVDKVRRKGLVQMTYAGELLNVFKDIRTGYFSVYFEDNIIQVYGCLDDEYPVSYEVNVTVTTTAFKEAKACGCARVWKFGDNMYMSDGCDYGLWNIQHNKLMWKKELRDDDEELTVLTIG